MNNFEIWKPIKGYEGLYEISNMGRIKSLEKLVKLKNGKHRLRKERILSSTKEIKDKYILTKLVKENVYENVSAHRLVAIHFVDGYEKDFIVNHKNSIRGDNRCVNLEWVNTRENITHAINTGRIGCYFHKYKRKWHAALILKGKKIHIGYYDTSKEANKAYKKKLKELGERNIYS